MSTAEVIALYSCPQHGPVHPVKQLQPTGGFVDLCPKCGGGVVCEGKAEEQREERPPVPAPSRQSKATAAPTDDVLDIAMRRLAFVREQIVSLRKFEAEEAMLQRMVDAANTE